MDCCPAKSMCSTKYILCAGDFLKKVAHLQTLALQNSFYMGCGNSITETMDIGLNLISFSTVFVKPMKTFIVVYSHVLLCIH
jgi:hypothetical protein